MSNMLFTGNWMKYTHTCTSRVAVKLGLTGQSNERTRSPQLAANAQLPVYKYQITPVDQFITRVMQTVGDHLLLE